MSGSAKVQMDYKYIARLAGTLLAISAVTALLLGLVNYVTAPIIEQIQAETKAAAMAEMFSDIMEQEAPAEPNTTVPLNSEKQ